MKINDGRRGSFFSQYQITKSYIYSLLRLPVYHFRFYLEWRNCFFHKLPRNRFPNLMESTFFRTTYYRTDKLTNLFIVLATVPDQPNLTRVSPNACGGMASFGLLFLVLIGYSSLCTYVDKLGAQLVLKKSSPISSTIFGKVGHLVFDNVSFGNLKFWNLKFGN
jgi:hypothetical protein